MKKHPRLRRLGVATVLLLLTLLVLTLVTTDGGASFGVLQPAKLDPRINRSPLYRDGRFENPIPTDTMRSGSMWEATAEWFTGDEQRVPPGPLPLFPQSAEVLATAPSTGLRVTWFGHSTALVELDGVRVLTDPQWSERASPSSIVGPERWHAPPAPLAALGKVDAVVISHDHYDHLDMETVQALADMGARFVVPLGVGTHLQRWGIPGDRIRVLEWWEDVTLAGGVRIVSTPAQHFSGRFLFRNPTLWSSWSIVGPVHRVFYSGDTGLGPHMEEIGRRLGPFDVTMLEIGQYHPSWGDIHLGPVNALKAHRALKGRALLPVHWGTFQLGMHGWSEPAETLVQQGERDGVRVLTPQLGQPVEPAAAPLLTAWWRDVR